MKTLTLAFRSLRNRRTTALLTLAAIAVSVALLVQTDRFGTQALHVGGWGPTEAGLGPLGITWAFTSAVVAALLAQVLVLGAMAFWEGHAARAAV